MRREPHEAVRIRVWDFPTRLVHWLLVPLVAASWLTAERNLMIWHRLSGYLILALVVFRIYWGFGGSSTARFASFLAGPRAVVAYLRSALNREPEAGFGHNPVGGWSVIALLGALLLQTGLGLFAVDVDAIVSGPLAHLVSFDTGRRIAAWHDTNFDVLAVLIAMHIAAVMFHLIYRREDLIRPMFSGLARLPAATRQRLRGVPAWRAWLGAALAGLITAVLAAGLRL